MLRLAMRAHELAQRILRQLGHVLVRLGGDFSQLTEQGGAHAESGAHGNEILAPVPGVAGIDCARAIWADFHKIRYGRELIRLP